MNCSRQGGTDFFNFNRFFSNFLSFYYILKKKIVYVCATASDWSIVWLDNRNAVTTPHRLEKVSEFSRHLLYSSCSKSFITTKKKNNNQTYHEHHDSMRELYFEISPDQLFVQRKHTHTHTYPKGEKGIKS